MNRGESPGRLKYSCFRDPNVSMGESLESLRDKFVEPQLGREGRRAAWIFVFAGLGCEWIRAEFRLGLWGGHDKTAR